MDKTIVVFDGSYEGFLNIVYNYFYEKIVPFSIVEETMFQQSLESSYYFVKTDYEKSEKVYKALIKKISYNFAKTCYTAFLCESKERFINIFNFILLGFKNGSIIEKYTHIDDVLVVKNLETTVLKESHKQAEFLRFKETESGVFYGEMSPKNNVISLLADHFCDRFNFAFIIHDVKRNKALIYDTKECLLTDVSDTVNLTLSEKEKCYQDLWKVFFKSIENESRRNHKLQRQLSPLYFRKHMVEFD